MARTLDPSEETRYVAAEAHGPAHQAYVMLHLGFVAAPVVAGADKFVDLLCNWDKYLAPELADRSPLPLHATMMVIGGIEVGIALLVALRPKVGAYVLALWLAGIIANLILLRMYFDVALRDFGLLLGAIALGRLAAIFHVPRPSARRRRVGDAHDDALAPVDLPPR